MADEARTTAVAVELGVPHPNTSDTNTAASTAANKRAPSRSPQPQALSEPEEDDNNDDGNREYTSSSSSSSKAPPLSRRAKRREQKRLKPSSSSSLSPSPSAPTTSSSPPPPPPPPTNPAANRKKPNNAPSTNPITHPPRSMPRPPPIPLLIASIGNPGAQYANTLHSAGHTVLNEMRELLRYPPWSTTTGGASKQQQFGGGLVAHPPPGSAFSVLGGYRSVPGEGFVLWQSRSLMNESGRGVAAALRGFLRELPPAGAPAAAAAAAGAGRPRGLLVVVHDEMEMEFGKVKLRDSRSSLKGHNGLKSVQQVLGKGELWLRIGIGIGRPVSREPDAVSRYVLAKMNGRQREMVEGCADQVIRILRDVEEGMLP